MRIDAIHRYRWLTVCCWCAASAFAQVPPDKESGVGGLRLRSSRTAETWQLELTRAGFTPDGVSRLKPLLEQARDQFLTGDSVSVTGGQLVEQWLAAAPFEQWERWDSSIRNEARLAWKRWEDTRDEAVLRDFLQSYGPSRQGLTGWKTLSRHSMDEARWDHAAAGLDHILRHRAATPNDRAQAVMELVAVRVREHRFRDADALAKSHAEILSGKSVRWQGTLQSTEAVLSRLLPDPLPPAPMTSMRPTMTPRFSKPIPLPKEVQEYWTEWRRDYLAEGAWLNPAAEPLIVGDFMIVQTISGLEAVKVAGKSEGWRVRHDDWRRMLEQAEKWGSREWRGQVLDQLVRRESADSILGRISTDGQRVFAITGGVGSELDRLVPGKNAQTGPRDDTAGQALVENRFSAYDVKTGELLWQAGGPSAGPTYRFANMFFCGPPCVVDGTLYVVGQQETELQLVAMDAVRGERLWSTVLGDVPRSLASDPTRQRTACPVVWDDGLLIATTANGAVIAVDALTHAPRWAYRYPTTPREVVMRPREQNTNFQPDPWWDAWRDARLYTVGNSIVFVSPESQRLHVIDRRTGAPQWTAAREDALWLTGADGERVYVAGPHHLAAWKLADGQPAWRTTIPDSGGRPALMATEILQPLANRHLARIDLTKGSVQLMRGIENPVMGNLVTDGKDWCGISGDFITTWRTDDENATVIRARETADPMDVVPKIEAARLKLDAGDRQGARAALPKMQSPPDALIQTAWQITLADLAAEPATWRDQAAELPAGVFTDESFEIAEAIITAARKNGDLVDAGRLILKWLDQPVQNETVLVSGARRHVRVDLACLGLWDDVWRQADASQRAALSQLLEDIWKRAAEGTDPFAVARLLELWHPLPLARQKAQQADERHFLGRSFSAVELQLLSLAASASGPEAGRLWQRLAREQSQAGFPRAATASLARAKQIDSQLVIDPDLDLAVPPRTEWPTKSPLIESQHERNYDVHQSAVPLDLDSSEFFDDLDVSVDRNFHKVYFTSREQRRTWILPLPKSLTNIREYVPQLVMGWGRGRVLLLRVGSELFAIAPLDERDEPVARILWTVDMLAESMVLADHRRGENLPAIPGVREEDVRVVSAFGRTIAQVGPMRAGFVCFHEKGKLVCLDTFTGRKRWEQHGLPFDARSFGDEEHVLVWSPARQSVDVLRAFDGKLLATRSWDAHPDRLILLQDTRAYRQIPQPSGWQLRCEDVVTGRVIWSHAAPAGASPVVLDRDVIGLAEPAGHLRFLSVSDGHELAEAVTFPSMPQMERAIVSRDAETWYVVISNRISRQAALQPANNRYSHRTPTVDGPLLAIDRSSFRQRWQATFARTPWLLDQPRTAPLLLHAYKLGTPDQITNGITNGVIRLLDKRTGAEVLHREGTNLLGFATFQSDPDRGIVDVRLEQETIRLRYHPHPPAPASPEP